MGLRQKRDVQAFLGSCAFLTGMLAATAACVFPVMLRSSGPRRHSLTAYNSAVPATSLETAFTWWIVGFPLAVLYFVVLFRAAPRQGRRRGGAARVLAAERTEILATEPGTRSDSGWPRSRGGAEARAFRRYENDD